MQKQSQTKDRHKDNLKNKVPDNFPATSARAGALVVLLQVLEERAYTNIAVNQFLRAHELEGAERRFFTELVYGTVKALGTLDWYLSQCASMPLSKLEKPVLAILRLSLYQLLFLERVPASAACNEAVKLARRVSHEGSAKFVNAVLRGFLRKQAAGEINLPAPETDDAGYLSLKYFHPRWLVKRWLGPWGREGTEALLAFDNAPAPVCLRTNTLATTRAQLLAELEKHGVRARASGLCEEGIVCERVENFNTLLKKLPDAFYVQDESSMLVGKFAAPAAGMSVLDLCSAPGGKATHLAQLMQDEGSIIACDIHAHKLKLIEENAARLGISIIRTQLNDATRLRSEWLEKFDLVLADAPCSGTGVLRRRAEARWLKERKELKIFPPLQLAILENARRYVKPGGRLLYSTCTLEQAENHYLIEEFLARHGEWRRVEISHPLTGAKIQELQLLPQQDNVDGFYICVLEKK